MISESVRACLDRILRSRAFGATKRNRKFLRHVVEAELAGNGQEVSSYQIATEVFGRGADFDQRNDPIVRVEATKLRRDLQLYFATAGRGERIVISIPKGGYRPWFEARDESKLAAAESGAGGLDPSGLAIASLRLDGSSLSALQPPFRAQLADELARCSDLSVYVCSDPDAALLDSETVRRTARSNGTAFVLSGDTWSHDTQHVVIRLHAGATGRLLWSEKLAVDVPAVVPLVASRVAEAWRRFAPSAGGNGVG